MDHNIPPLLTLIGDEEENFYQLGVKDRENCSATFKHLKSLTSLNNQFLDVIIEESLGKLGSSIIGKNGAGKSTLLKIISRITSPGQTLLLLKPN